MNGQTRESIRLGVLFLGRRRPGFDPEWGAEMEVSVRGALAQTGFQIIEPPEKVVDDPTLKKGVEHLITAGAQVVVALQTTMADARMAPTLSQEWVHPILLWATPENPTGDMISSCSLVGAHAWASALRMMKHPFEVVYGDPNDPEVQRALCESVRMADTSRRLRRARIGIVGGQAPGYFAMSADPFSVRGGVGAQVQQYSLPEFSAVAEVIGEEEIATDVGRMRDLGLRHKDTSAEDLPMASRLYLAMRHYFETESVDALAVRCWPEMPNTFGQWPYLGMARLSDEGFPVACEGDADGALTALVGEGLGLGACYLSDWLEHDSESITLWHGGNAPFSLSPPPTDPGGPELARHFNSGKPMVVESTLRSDMDITICRLWRLDGRYRITSCDARTTEPRRHLMGSNGLAVLRSRDPRQWFDELCHEGMPHHVAVFGGNHTDQLRRFARLMSFEWVG